MEPNQPTVWATAEDWARHRQTITRLYVDEGKTLREVIQIMRNNYHFHATIKMYKTRIKYWGLAKNLTANEVHSILRTYRTHIAADNAKPTVFIRGRPIDSEKVERYLRRTTKDFPDLIAPSEGEGHQDQPLVAVLSPHQLRSPDVFKLPEEIIFLSNQLAAGSRENGLWAMYDDTTLTFATREHLKWEHQLTSGRYLARSGYHKHAFRIFQNTFAFLEQLIQNYEPVLFIHIMCNTLNSNPDISQRLLHHAAEMSKAKLSAHHPFTLIMNKLSRAGLERIQEFAWKILISYVDTLHRLFGKSQEALSLVTYWLLNDACCYGLIGQNQCLAQIKSAIKQSESRGQHTHMLQAKTIMVNMLWWSGQYTEAKVILDQVTQENRKIGNVCDKDIDEQSRMQHFFICQGTGTVEEVVNAGRECLQFLTDYHGAGYYDAIWLASMLATYLKDHGIQTGHVKLQEYLDPEWGAFCRGLEIPIGSKAQC